MRHAWCAGVLLLAGTASSALAHDSRPLYVELNERPGGYYALQWRVPPVLPAAAWPTVTLHGGDCRPAIAPAPRPVRSPAAHATYACRPGSTPDAVEVRYPVVNPSLSTLVRMTPLSGATRVASGGPDVLRIDLPKAPRFAEVARTYTVLGVRHILGGPDHLLFLACLLWIAGTFRRIVVAITGFTLAHSLTLALATLGVVTLPVVAMEACIALSVMFLAAEIVRGSSDTLAWRHPLAVSFAFGLLHGFGFASALHDAGLPRTQVVGALLFFNAGVEIGQLAFAAALVALGALAKPWLARWRTARGAEAPAVPGAGAIANGASSSRTDAAVALLAKAPACLAGTVASFWFVQRLATIIGA